MKNNVFNIPLKIQNSPVENITAESINCQGSRPYQEDSFGFSPADKKAVEKYGFMAVLGDGMGGLSDGAHASSTFVSSMLEMHSSRDMSLPVHIFLKQAFKTINGQYIASGAQGGTTGAAVLCLSSGIYWCSLGDSRIYLFRNGILTALSEDTDHLNSLLCRVIKGDMTVETALADPRKDSLRQYIGFRGDISPDGNIRPLIPEKGDRLLICSDGVYNAVSGEVLCGAMSVPTGETAEKLEETVLAGGFANQDNFTALILSFG
ncbi:MAG: PP2C family protein-serine/threonine phosphatase [Huintestinicola sp.]|uniref:PP2C family protein-serine/threonine phosphatase n=1 Tax=Huintestinicola sp. TaxID=2981661 RepID=UPI003EFFEAB3